MFQRTMAVILKTTLEDMLFVPEQCNVLPSPNELIGKVVLKGKRPPDKEDFEEMRASTSVLGAEKVDIEKGYVQTSTSIVEDLAKLTLLNGVSFKDFETSLELPSTDMHSFSETKIGKVLTSPEIVSLWRKYNR
jgi:hypothetical protein